MYNYNEKRKRDNTCYFLRSILSVMLMAIMASVAVGCNKSDKNSTLSDAPIDTCVSNNTVSAPDYSIAENGGDNMTREFVEVALIADDHIMLENTRGMFYWIDIEYNNNYSEGDLLFLAFKNKEKLEEGCWRVEPELLYVNDNSADIPRV